MFVPSYVMHACKIKGGREEGGGEREKERERKEEGGELNELHGIVQSHY